jgi:hypothetical protein
MLSEAAVRKCLLPSHVTYTTCFQLPSSESFQCAHSETRSLYDKRKMKTSRYGSEKCFSHHICYCFLWQCFAFLLTLSLMYTLTHTRTHTHTHTHISFRLLSLCTWSCSLKHHSWCFLQPHFFSFCPSWLHWSLFYSTVQVEPHNIYLETFLNGKRTKIWPLVRIQMASGWIQAYGIKWLGNRKWEY